MRVVVRIVPGCLSDTGERTPDQAMLIRTLVEAFRDTLGEHSGQLPGALRVLDKPETYKWEDANWRVGYALERSGQRLSVSIQEITLKWPAH